jgi:hypothetical protein
MDINPNQNLLKQVKPEQTPHPKGFWTLLVFEALAILLAGVFGYTAAAYLKGALPLAVALGAALAFFSVSPFGTFFGTTTTRRLLVIVLETAAFIVFFHTVDSKLLFGSAAVLALFSAWGDSAARRELENRVRIKFTAIAHLKIGRMFTGFLLAGILLTLPQWSNSALPISQQQFRTMYDATVHLFGGT